MRPAVGFMLCLALLACAKPGEDHYGRGMDAYREKDYAAAANYLQQAADSGHVLGMATLAGMLLQGKGVPRDAVKAASWFEKAEPRLRGSTIDYWPALFQWHRCKSRCSQSAPLVR